MLADPRAQTLVTGFALRWLNVDELDAVDARRAAVPRVQRRRCATTSRKEIELFIASVLLENRDVHELLTAD